MDNLPESVQCQNNPLFSVIIVNWNGVRHLAQCLESLRRQSLVDFEIVLVDNGSSDGSVEFVKNNYPEVTLTELQENAGFAGGVNAGIKASCGDYVVLLNNDTEVSAAWLEQLSAAVETHPDVFIFASKLVNYFQRMLIDSAGDGMDLCAGPYKIGELQPSDQFKNYRFIFGACGGGGCYKRELFDRIGFFDEDFFAYFEDSDLSFRANWAGYRCLFVPEAVIYHKVGGTADANQASRARFDIMRRRNFFFLIIKNYPASFLLRYFPYFFAVHCLVFLANLLRGHFNVAFMTQFEIAKGLPAMLRKRKIILQERVITSKQMLSRCEPKCRGRLWFLRRKCNSVLAH